MNPKIPLTAFATLVALASAGAARADVTFLPGLYEVKVSYPAEGAGTETSRRCLTPAKAKQDSLERRLADAVQDPSCRYTQRSIGAGRFAITGTCNNEGVRTTVKQTGTYSPTSMTMVMDMTMAAAPGEKPLSLKMQMSGRRVAATCPPGSEND